MSTLDKMWKEFVYKFSRLPVWLPGTQVMNLGDIGVIDKRGWQRVGNLSDYEIAYSPAAVGVPAQYEVSSRHATTENVGVSAATGTQALGSVAAAGLNLKASFSASGAFVVRAYNVRGQGIDNVGDVDNQLAAQDARTSFWRKRWIYVSEVVTAEPFLILVSAASGASASVTAEADLTVAGAPNGAVKLGVSNSSAMEQSFVSAERTPFMWRGRWRGKWYSNRMKDLGDRGSTTTEPAEDNFQDFNSPGLYEVALESAD